MANTLEDADAKLVAARSELPVGSFIQHYARETVYRVLDHAIREEDLEVVVTYEEADPLPKKYDSPFAELTAALQPKPIKRRWSRPFADIIKPIVIPSGRIPLTVPRFAKVKPQMCWVPVN